MRFITPKEREIFFDGMSDDKLKSVKILFSHLHTLLNDRLRLKKENLPTYIHGTDTKCNFCHIPSHSENECRKKQRKLQGKQENDKGIDSSNEEKNRKSTKLTRSQITEFKKAGKCFKCGVHGHRQYECTGMSGHLWYSPLPCVH